MRRILEDHVIIRGNEGGINCLRRSIKEGGGGLLTANVEGRGSLEYYKA